METKTRRGFAAMDPTLQRELARQGGVAAHAKGTAHEFTSEEGSAAGRKGGAAHSPEHMAAIGRIGGSRTRDRGLVPESLVPDQS